MKKLGQVALQISIPFEEFRIRDIGFKYRADPAETIQQGQENFSRRRLPAELDS